MKITNSGSGPGFCLLAVILAAALISASACTSKARKPAQFEAETGLSTTLEAPPEVASDKNQDND